MTDDQRLNMVHRYVAELVALESDIEQALGRQMPVVRGHKETAAAVQRFHGVVKSQRDALKAHLESLNDGEAHSHETVFAGFFGPDLGGEGESGWQTISALLRADYTAFSYATMSYAMLHEIALRLYDSPLREIAPRHLRAYAEAARTFNQLIADVVAWELQQDGLGCHCICPMCGIGACGCVAFCTETLNAAWRETATAEEAAPGFPLLRPRVGSQLALAGVQAGDRLLEVDDQPVRSFRDVQAAIRKHQLGEEVRLFVQRGSEPSKEVRAKYVSDYPRT